MYMLVDLLAAAGFERFELQGCSSFSYNVGSKTLLIHWCRTPTDAFSQVYCEGDIDNEVLSLSRAEMRPSL